MAGQKRNYANEPIAIVGSACRFPGESSSPSKLWKLLRQPKDILKEIPKTRFSVDGFYHPNNVHHGSSNVRHSYFLEEDIRVFDAAFFGIKPVEANSIDPQQRLLMETVYEGLEAAGISIGQLQGSQTAVYVGLMSNDYGDMLGNDQENFPTYFATGTARSIVSNRVSYFFDWHGPSMTIDTACSSSLVAVHQAVQILRAGDGTDVAVACGTNLLLNPDQYIAESKLKMLSPEGRSRMWDEKANGYARGDGIAAIILKRLSQAIADNDHIEAVIRETQLNQDGRTKGITMPSAEAQAALIRATYAKAGLDISKPSDRPQFFEAHGTGTPAGDPIEASAIHNAFYGSGSATGNGSVTSKGAEPLYVGSIKTVIGHTEGTAGLAAVLKASLAIQHGVIPPNLLFDRLSPKVEPYYKGLKIPTEPRPWPALATGAVRRVSVNSFGFGGANAHAILEAYEPAAATAREEFVKVPSPINLSASSENALRAMLRRHADFLEANGSTSIRDLAFTLNTRRTTFPFRTSIYAATPAELSKKLRARAETDKSVLLPVQARTLSSKPHILGIFTGQGAQWSRMGAELLVLSPAAAATIESLEQSLAELPDGPTWSIKDEILAGATSRVNEAAISQPLCTAVQIMLVQLLRGAGIHFHAVVGHSSGEMGAAYAAGYLSASDAIRIAYYRGLHLHLAQGPKGEIGAMMAVGTSFEDAQDLCDLPAFKGRISVAASNSSASVTLSGDKDAIEWARDVFEDEKKFARLLKVDKAYHSHHMLACSDAYGKSLADCKINAMKPARAGTTWISSVHGEDAADHWSELGSQYWIDNMVSPVLFSQAVEFAAADKGPFDAAIECGPHPALKGPALQVLQEFLGNAIPYTGLLNRGKNDNESFAEGLGYLWQALGEMAVDYSSFDKFVAGPKAPAPRILKNLPCYAWDHERAFWHESRQYQANRTKPDAPHELLGTKCPDGTEQQQRWRNMLRPQEIPWLSGHRIQGQMVFPAAGYVSTAFEAAKLATVSEGKSLKSIEIQDFVIGQAIAFNDEYASVETQFTLTNIVKGRDSWTAKFSFYSATQKSDLILDLNAYGTISVVLGESDVNLLPPNNGREFNTIEVDPERFYDSLSKLGFGYTGPFRTLGSLQRRMGVATGTIQNPASTDPSHDLLLHPATFDLAIQSIILAYCYPNDNRLWSVHLPTQIKRIKINPGLCEMTAGKEVTLQFRASITSERSTEIEGDVELYDEEGRYALMQLEGMNTKPLGHATAANDSPLFLETIWDIAEPSKATVAAKIPNLQHKAQLAFDIERVAFFYLRNLGEVATKEDRDNAEHHIKIFFSYIDHCTADVKNGTAKYVKREWIYDTHAQIHDIIKKYPDSMDMKMMHAVGEHLIPVVRKETTMLEYMREDNMLNKFYVEALGFDEYTEALAEQVAHFGHRYPHMNILEIGAGTGGATKRIFKTLGKKFGSYTYTDISSGFFETAREVFGEFESKMHFKPLNCEKDPSEQGFTEGSYDLIVASLVLHATHEMDVTMANVRKLLRPGGYLIILELGEYIEMRTGLIFGTLSGWWMGHGDGRKLSPTLPEEGWNACLRRTGFSGVDAAIPIQASLPVSLTVIIGQAVDSHVNFLRNPVSSSSLEVIGDHLTIIGGTTEKISRIADSASSILAPFYNDITLVKSFAELGDSEVPFMGSALILTDLDEPIFERLSPAVLKGAQRLFARSKTCLWITSGSGAESPFQNMSVGLGRVVKLEMTHLRLQSLDVDNLDENALDAIITQLLRYEVTEFWEQKSEASNLLWSVEPELLYKDGNFMIPRLMPSQVRNDRYNSSRRLITKEENPQDVTVGLRWSPKGYELHVEAPAAMASPFDGRIELQVTYSTLEAIRVTSTDYAYLVFGTNLRTKEQVFALVPERHSIVRVSNSWTIPYSASTEEALCLMPVLKHNLVASATISDFSSGETLVVIEPEREFGEILACLAAEKGVRLVMITKDEVKPGSSWTFLHPNAPKRTIKSAMPQAASILISCSDDKTFVKNVEACLSENCKARGADYFASKASKLDSFSSIAFIPTILRTAFVRAHHGTTNSSKSPIVLSASDIVNHLPTNDSTLFSWVSTATVPVKVTPVDATPLFSVDKTYWLVGLTGGLGLSLCEWMIRRGAKYVVLTSRNPKVDPAWEEHIKTLNAVVKIFPNDITDRKSVEMVYKKITQELPPIGGVAQGAMVLADTMFGDLDIERVKKVVGPKVNGAIYLEELFANTPLEFFVFFSSMAYVTGNQGQSIYAAANGYMAALAAQRRKRGVAGSAINIGTIIGNGYVTRALTTAQQEYLTHMGNVFMSEQDFHQIFAEAVVAGRPCSTEIPEIMTGLRLAHIDDADKVTWFHNPKFSHCVLWPEASETKKTTTNQNITVKSQLLLATTHEEVNAAIEDAFSAKLKASLQIDEATSIVKMDAEQLGLDSLVAVDIRSWFIKELNVEMPVLKILGGYTVSELVDAAQESLPASFIPNIGKEIDPSLKASVKGYTAPDNPVKQEPKPSAGEGDFAAYDEGEEDGAPTFSAREHQPINSELLSNKLLSDKSRTKVAFSASPVTPLSEDLQKSSYEGSIPSDDDSDTYRKSRVSTTTSVSIMEDYFQRKDEYNLERIAPMSFGQARFWFLKFYLEDQTTFNITTSIRLNGELNIEDFARAVRAVGRRHEALRTTFFTDKDNQPVQGVLRNGVLRLAHRRIQNEKEIESEYTKIKNHIYDIGRGETMKITLLSSNEGLHQLIIGYHHINMDGISLEVIIRDLQSFYYNNRPPPVALQYPEFSQIQRKEHATGQWANEIAFWKSEFAEIPTPLPILPLSAKTTRSALTRYHGNTVEFRVSAAVATQIQNACKRTRTSPFNFYLAAFKTLLYRCIGDEKADICIGMADGGRNIERVSESVGFFLNLLPLRFLVDSSQSFNEALKEARTKVIAAIKNSKVPFDVLLNEVNAPRDPTHNPLFQAFINYREGVRDKRNYMGCESEATKFDGSQTAYDIAVDILANPGDESVIFIAGQSVLYSQSDVEILAHSFHTLLKAFAKNPALRLGRPSLYDPEATQMALDTSKGPELAESWPETLVHRVDDMAKAYSSKEALRTPRSKLTYAQLSGRVNAIAATLKATGITRGSRVGVFQDPASDFFCTLLAVLRVGATFIPLELRLTLPRLASMIEDSKPDAIVYDSANQKDLKALGNGFKKINVSSIAAKASAAVPNEATADGIAIILYTSGSTGKPKGILLSHSAWRNQIQSSSQIWQVSSGTGVHLQHSAWSFDISISQTFVALANGACLYVPAKEQRGDSLATSKAIISNGVTHVQATPQELVSWLHYADTEALRASKWEFAMSGGERMTPTLIQEFRKLAKKDLRLVNAYGPAEIALAIGSVEVDYEVEDSLDKPFKLFPNYSVYALDARMRPLPAGMPGELYIGGAGVAKGYLNNDTLNEERFLDDKFAPAEYIEQNWNKMHRSGDRGRLTETGGVVLEGRIEGDTQIKLRGIRIDLKDIESTIVQESNGSIRQAVVSVQRSGDTEFLVAHVVLPSIFDGDSESFLSNLMASLPVPQYMRPAKAIPLDQDLPTNHSGKVDRKAIAALPIRLASKAAPVPEVKKTPEAQVKEIWQNVLGEEITSLQELNFDSDFFHIGGNSLALVKIQGLMKTTFNLEVSLVKLFENSSLGAMIRLVDRSANASSIFEHPEPNRVDDVSIDDRVVKAIPSTTMDPTGAINWELETALTDDLYELEISAAAKDQGLPFKQVTITGTTGFLGRELVRQMIEDNHIDKINAIAVRRPKSELPSIFSHEKVVVYHGDLNAPLLGLSPEDAYEIFSTTDAVIHNGADVSFLKTYRTLAKTNLGSTRELVKLCLPNRIPMHFVSSASVVHLTGKASFGEASVGAFEPPVDGTDGYTATKWASERFLENVSEKFQLPIWIHRPSSISGDDAPALDLMSNMLRFAKRIHKVPYSPAWTGTLDFVNVERVAKEILHEVMNDSAGASDMIRYLYQSGDLEIKVEDMKSSLESQTDQKFESIDLATWAVEAEKQGLEPLVAAYLKGADKVPIVFPRLIKAPRKRAVVQEVQEPRGFIRGVVERWVWRRQ